MAHAGARSVLWRALRVVRALVLGALGAALVRPTPSPVRKPAPPIARTVAPPLPTEPTYDVTPTVTQVEGLLQLDRADAALQALATLPPPALRQVPVQRVRAYTLLAAERIVDLRDLLGACDLTSLEVAYLSAAADLRARGGDTTRALATLWWTEPDTVWGASALRELVQLEKSGYSPKEREVVLATVSPATASSYLTDATAVAYTLTALQKRAPPKSRLAVEVELALGVYALHTDHYVEASDHLELALSRARNPELRRAVDLRLAEVRRRQGEFADALKRFERVAAGGNDALGTAARAAAGQMAIEQQRYRDAQHLFREQLLDNPVGEARATALFGLGWVAFRTGAFADARQFFATLTGESPFGPLAPAATYWGARALDELGDRQRARGELAALAARFPHDYYAFRARERVGDLDPSPTVILPPTRRRPDLEQLRAVLAAGQEKRARGLVGRLVAAVDSLSPDELDDLVAAATRLGRTDQAATAQRVRCERFGAAGPATPCEALDERFPADALRALAERAEAERLPTDWLLAAAYAASRLTLDRPGDRGELGLFQLTRLQLASLVREETHRHQVSAEQILDAEANLRLSARWFARVARAFGGRLDYALAAFQAGPGAVTRWREARGELPGDIFVEEIPYAETRAFVRRGLATLALHRALHRPRPVPKIAKLGPGTTDGVTVVEPTAH